MDKRTLWAVVAVVLLGLFFVAIGTPNLLRSRSAANESARIGKLRTQRQEIEANLVGADALFQAAGKASINGYIENPQEAAKKSKDDSKKVIQASSLEMLVKDVDQTCRMVEQLTQRFDGEVEKADINGTRGSTRGSEILIRVPANRMDDAITEFRKSAIRVQSEHRESRDISREYVDGEARLRNLKAQEQQYLVLLGRAGSMKDTLEVTEKLSEVRGEIEQLQGELNWWSHQVAMSAIHLSLSEEAQASVVARWRPLYNAQTAMHEMLIGLGDWFDLAVAVLIKLPLVLLWVGSMGGVGWACWRVGRWVWIRWLRPVPQATSA